MSDGLTRYGNQHYFNNLKNLIIMYTKDNHLVYKVYLSMPMKGIGEEIVRGKEKRYRETLKEKFGDMIEIVSPLENGLPYDAPVCQHMTRDYRMLLDCDAIYLCSGWEYSHGCMNELQMAADARLYVMAESNDALVDDEGWYYEMTERD